MRWAYVRHSNQPSDPIGFAAGCDTSGWSGDRCNKPWIRIPAATADSASKARSCFDGTERTKLRPMWHGDLVAQGQLWCWIMTGSSAYTFASSSGGGSYTTSGWMYTASSQQCTPHQRRHETHVINMGTKTVTQTWSFDSVSWSRSGSFSSYQCSEPLPNGIKG